MPIRSLTELLKSYHDKLNEHTAALHDVQTKITSLEAAVHRLDDEIADEGESSGARAGLRDWINNIRELL